MKKLSLSIEQKQQIANDLAFICDDCHEFTNIVDGANFKTFQGTITLCHGCGEEFEDNCRQSRDEISEIEDDIIFFSGRDFTSHLR